MNKHEAAQRIYLIQQNIKALQDEVDTLKEQHFVGMTQDAYMYGDYHVSVQPNRRFSPALARKVLTTDEYAATLVTKPDTTKARDVLPPERFRLCQSEGVNKVVITIRTEDD